MSHQAAREFLEKSNKDASFREKHLPSTDATWDEKVNAALRVGPQFGYQFTAKELTEVEGVKSFWRQVAGDPKLQEKLKAVSKTTDPKAVVPAVVKIASEAGFAISPAVLQEVTQGGHGNTGGADQELSEADLEQVAGGATVAAGVPAVLQTISTGASSKLASSTIMCPW